MDADLKVENEVTEGPESAAPEVAEEPKYGESVERFLASDNVSMMGGWT